MHLYKFLNFSYDALFIHDWVVRFTSSSYNENLSLQSKYKYIKNTMVRGIVQKSYKALFPLRSLKKRYIGIKKKITQRKDRKPWKES